MTASDPVDQARAWLDGADGQVRWSSLREGARRRHRGRGSAGARPAQGCRSPVRASDSGRRATVGRTTLGRGRRHVGIASDADADADAENVARTIALRKLTGQARTRHELDQALQKKNVPDEVAADGARPARGGRPGRRREPSPTSWVESRQQRRHLSRSALRRELQRKGVDRDQVDAALATVDTDAELAAARALVAKKQGAPAGLDPLVRHRRLTGALARRGFGSGIIATVLGELRDGPDDDPVLDPGGGAS